jgi:hypothetical protein
MSFCLQQHCMALSRHSTLSRQLQLARSAQRHCTSFATVASGQTNSSTAAMDLQSSVPHEQLVEALRSIVPALDRKYAAAKCLLVDKKHSQHPMHGAIAVAASCTGVDLFPQQRCFILATVPGQLRIVY